MTSKQKRTRLQKLQNSWAKATLEERSSFIEWLRHADLAADGSAPALNLAPIASGRYLLPSAVARVQVIMTKRNLTAADVMVEMGFECDDPSLARALDDHQSLRLAVVAALETWLIANSTSPPPLA
ncbi:MULTISPECIES: hypothetical protein [Alphaproteobacteria]|uniref:Uncharacterized protein n=2 Tax=Alphaproteobacteria TaxID=28211 RepID=A0A512HL06_9HYPH|nr:MULTISPECIES: hypothetical protein [Alphaproteobacteria]GEO86138.1 hypothetical protein RNA01_30700 [Ciceribacter naphthalenivorans]GLR22705.1 hypothetical protein GCM10007920_24930 [Ciceribacter naphthalenivorans]GLT05561.1 hypothetical protein GCM10007926_24930 [Sphingomonas psychrolutea]